MKTLPCWRSCLAIALLSCALTPQVRAQDEEAEKRPVMQVEVEPDSRMPGGKSAFLEGEADATDQWFMVQGTEVMQPISVGVYTRDPGDEVRVRIVKDDWDKAEREANTSGGGKAEFHFRTFDNFKIGVDAKTPTAYQLVVWVGDELQVAQPSIAVPASTYVESATNVNDVHPADSSATSREKPNGISLSYLEIGLLALLLAIIVGFAAVKLSRRKNN